MEICGSRHPELLETEADWDAFRATDVNNVTLVSPVVKEEPVDENAIEEVDINGVFNLRSDASEHFRDGRRIASFISLLRDSVEDQLLTPWLKLNVMKARFSISKQILYI